MAFRRSTITTARVLALLLWLFCFLPEASGQLLPAEKSQLNYRLIGFSFPSAEKKGEYKIEIASGTYYNLDSFNQNVIISEKTSTNRKILMVPAFGKSYTWRVVGEGSSNAPGDLHHFSVKTIQYVDTTQCRLRILQNDGKLKDAYVFVDGNNAMYDMQGNPVWFSYVNSKEFSSGLALRDIKLSPLGTITFICGSEGFEINYNGDLLWRAPNAGALSGGECENYHHELNRLKNGDYMLLDNEWALRTLPNATDTNGHIVKYDKAKWEANKDAFRKIFLGMVAEYDKTGKIVWAWKSSNYFVGSDVDYYRDPNPTDRFNVDVHENAFFFDEPDKVVYVGFKNLNRLVKIRYPDGEVLGSYGETYRKGMPEKGNGLFCGQHGCIRSSNGELLLFDNNSCNAGACPKVLALQEPQGGRGDLKKTWEYPCTVEDTAGLRLRKYNWVSGGNIIELPDKRLFVCMGGNYSKVFIVNRDKEVGWSALPEKWNPIDKKWYPSPGYRASIVTDSKALEALIWNEEVKVRTP